MAECEFKDGVDYDSPYWTKTVDEWMSKLDISILHVFSFKPDVDKIAIEFEAALMGTGPLVADLYEEHIEYSAHRPVIHWGQEGDA
ncbi:MAG: hypothetical protein EBS90_11505 [Betaproteobacteria bacterium]|nr:hypothetical protein [Betaproteobacteria bacterium]